MNIKFFIIASIIFLCPSAFADNDIAKEMTALKYKADHGDDASALEYGEFCINIYSKLNAKGNYNCSEKEGYFYIKKLAFKGNAEAQRIFAENLYFGKIQPKNYQESFKFFMKSAKQGNSDAQKWISDFFDHIGIVVKLDPVKAYAWLSISNAVGGSDSVSLTVRELHLSQNQILDAQKFAKNCYESGYKKCTEIE